MSDLVRIGICLTRPSHQRLARLAKELDVSQSSLVEALVSALDDPEFAKSVKKVREKIAEARQIQTTLMKRLADNPDLAARVFQQIEKKKKK